MLRLVTFSHEKEGEHRSAVELLGVQTSCDSVDHFWLGGSPWSPGCSFASSSPVENDLHGGRLTAPLRPRQHGVNHFVAQDLSAALFPRLFIRLLRREEGGFRNEMDVGRQLLQRGRL